VLQEGKARILMLKGANDVFFNKAQVVNRDLSVLSLRLFQKVRQTAAVELQAFLTACCCCSPVAWAACVWLPPPDTYLPGLPVEHVRWISCPNALDVATSSRRRGRSHR
jgi:tRNA G26 N,N-dimethylase Trm1